MASAPPTQAPRLSTGEALARVAALLAEIDHDGRSRLSAEERLTLVTDDVAIGRQVEALRAVLVGEAERADAAKVARGASLRSLLATSAQVTAGEAAGWVFAGQELTGNARVRDAALAGTVSVSQARSIDKVLGELPATLSPVQRGRAEQIMLDKAHLMDAKGLADQTRTVLAEVAPEVDAVEDELARLDAQRKQAWAARSFTIIPDGRGGMNFRGSLPLREGQEFAALVAAHTQSNRRATEQAADRHDEAGLRTRAQRDADGLISWVRATAGGAARGPRPTATVVVTMSHDALQATAEQAGHLPDGQVLSAGELRQLLCDCALVPVVLGGTSQPLDVGRSRRLVTADLRRALEVRDSGCAFPGCAVAARDCEAHHIVPWWAGGATCLANLVLLCPHHHGTVEPLRFWKGPGSIPRWQVRLGTDGHPEFLPPARVGRAEQTPIRNQRVPQRAPTEMRPAREPADEPATLEQPLLE